MYRGRHMMLLMCLGRYVSHLAVGPHVAGAVHEPGKPELADAVAATRCRLPDEYAELIEAPE
jgi:hypothetical protein